MARLTEKRVVFFGRWGSDFRFSRSGGRVGDFDSAAQRGVC